MDMKLRPHIGMRKVKSLLAIFIGFWLWQLIRVFVPGLEVHPTFIYIYGVIEIRDTSEKTKDMGRRRILATLCAILVGLPATLIYNLLTPHISQDWLLSGFQLTLLILGTLVALIVAEAAKCGTFCGISAIIFILLALKHFDSSMYLYSLLRVCQTLLAVGIAWLLNVKLFPYPATPGSLSYYFMNRRKKKEE